MEKYMKIAIKEAKKAYKNGDVPVGSVIIKENEIISKAYNKKEKNNSAIMHAELIAIDKACKKLNTWHLDDCTLYTTMEPCMMCCGAIAQSRIKKVVFAVENNKYGFHKHLKNVEFIKYNKNNESLLMLKDFFEDIRN